MSYEEVLFALANCREFLVEDTNEKSIYYQRDDRLWKHVLEELFEDFLSFFFPEAGEIVDLSRGVEYLDKEFDQFLSAEEKDAGVRHVDKLVRVYLKNGKERYLPIHIEVQGQKGKEDFSGRMHRCWCRIKDKYGVPVTALAILTDSSKSFRPSVYTEECMGTLTWFKFNSYKVLDQDEEALRANPNPFALIILTTLLTIKSKKKGDAALLSIKRRLVREMLARNLDRERRKAVFNFLSHFVHFKEKEAEQAFKEDVQKLTNNKIIMGTEEYLLEKARTEGMEQGIEQGMERGIERGLKQGKEQVVKNLIVQLGLDDKQAASTAEVSIEFVQHIRRLTEGKED